MLIEMTQFDVSSLLKSFLFFFCFTLPSPMCLCRFAWSLFILQLSLSLVIVKLICEIAGFNTGQAIVQFVSEAFGLYDNEFENDNFISPSIEGISDYDVDEPESNWKEEKISSLTKQNVSLNVQLTNLQKELNQTKQKYVDFEEKSQQLHYLQSSNYEYQKTVRNITNEKSDFLQSITNLTKKIEETQSKLKISERAIINLTQSKMEISSNAQRLKTDKEALSEEIDKIQREMSEIKLYKHELLTKIEQNVVNERKIKNECYQILQQLNQYKQKYADKEMETEQTQEELYQTNTKLLEIQRDLHQKQSENELLCNSHSVETAKFRHQINKLQDAEDELLTTVENGRTEIDKYKQLIEELTREHSLIREIECKNSQQKDAEIELCKAKEIELQQKIIKISQEQKVKSDKLIARIVALKATQSMLQAKLEKDYADLEISMQAKIEELHQRNEDLDNASNQEKQMLLLEINVIKDQMQASKEELEEYKDIIHQKEQAILSLKIQNQKLMKQKEDILNELASAAAQIKQNLTLTSAQIKIAYSESKRAKSLSLCKKTQIVSSADGEEEEFGFLSFLENMKEHAVNTMCIKFKRDTIDAAHLFTMLTMTVIICNVKLHQLQTGRRDKPKINKQEIKEQLQHLCVYIIRTFGKRKENKEMICIRNEDGDEIKGKYYGYDFVSNKTEYANNVYQWVQSYVENNGAIDML